MSSAIRLPVILCLSLCLLLVHLTQRCALVTATRSLSREDFPKGFVFGTGSSAYQYEGAARQGGRGPSIWDTFSDVKGNIVGNANGNVAVDEYHRYKEDISLLSDMGMDAYRFSISWSRIYPEGKGEVNEVGVAYYNHLIDGLLEKGLKPFVTLYHWDLPQKLEDDYGGWLSSLIVDDYVNFANTCFARFGDRVKYWVTFNEPTTFILLGYNFGVFPPNRCSPWVGNCTAGDSATEPYIVAHNMLICHATVGDLYKRKYQEHQKGIIGITLVIEWYIPLTNSSNNVEAVKRLIDFTGGWYIEPILYGNYPSIMRKLVGDRLPTFTNHQRRMLVKSLDFLGINYYTTYFVEAITSYPNPQHTDFYQDSMTNTTAKRYGHKIGPEEASKNVLYIYPVGIYDLMKYLKETYRNIPPIYITENGMDEVNNSSLSLKEALNDLLRVKFYHEHLFHLSKAIKEGVDVRGFFSWSFLDDFEWTTGYTVRFGLYFVDFNTLKRHPKKSATWFKGLLEK